jgi:DNA invertase Pin-like site-specific DNA recombinase
MPIREKLPAGVTVVERAVCGASVTVDDLKQLADKIVDPANLTTVQNAEPMAIRSLLGAMGIHKSDSTNPIASSMVKATITFLLDWVNPLLIRIEPSGLIALPLRQPLPVAIMWTDPSVPLARSRFLHMYSNSVYPTADEMDAALTRVGIDGDISWDTYLEFRHTIIKSKHFLPIAERFPGVHYHIVCRAVDTSCEENATASRSESGIATGRTPEDIRISLFQDLIIKHSHKQDISGILAALPYSDFVIFYDKLIDYAIARNPGKSRRDTLCGRMVDLYYLISEVVLKASNPEQYRPQFYSAMSECNPGRSDAVKSEKFASLLRLRSDGPTPAGPSGMSTAVKLIEALKIVNELRDMIKKHPDLADALRPALEEAQKVVDELLRSRVPAPPPAPAPPPPPPADRPLQIGDRVRIINSDNPIRRAERFTILRRPLPTDLSSRGAKFGADVWMCEEVDSKKVVAIRETSLGLAPVQAGGALWPPKYYKGLSTRRKRQRYREITHRKKLSWKDPKAYRPFKTDRAATQRRPSSYTSRFHSKYPGVTGIPAIAKATGVSADTLRKVYNRGMAAWRTGHRPGASQEAWGMARVYSFVLHGKTWRTADKDLAGK